MYEVRNLTETSRETVLATFLKAFEDYVIPIPSDPLLHFPRWEAMRVDFSRSLGVFRGEELVSFVLLASDGQDLYNVVTGTVASERGKGHVPGMFRQIIARANEQRLLLDVIETNERAIRTYEKIGFKKARRFGGFEGPLHLEGPRVSFEAYDVLPFSKDLLPKGMNPVFEYREETLERRKQELEVHLLRRGHQVLAGCVFQPSRTLLHRLWGSEFRTLFSEMKLEGQKTRLVGVVESERHIWEQLPALGMKNFVNLWGMELYLR